MSIYSTSKSRIAFAPVPPQEEFSSRSELRIDDEIDDLGFVFDDIGIAGRRGRAFFCALIVVSAALVFFAK